MMVLIQYGNELSETLAYTAERMAQVQRSKLLVVKFPLANQVPADKMQRKYFTMAGENNEPATEQIILKQPSYAFTIKVEYFNAGEMTIDELFIRINQLGCELIITAYPEPNSEIIKNSIYKLVCRLNSALLFLPTEGCFQAPDRLVYITDLRYSQPRIIKFLAKLARPFGTKLLVAHLTASGLPDMDDNFANDLFTTLNNNTHCSVQPQFYNIKKTMPADAVDVLVNGLAYNALAMVNNGHHFENMDAALAHTGNLPLIIFPF